MTPYTEKRPWGEFTRFTQNEPSTVKIIIVNPGQAPSLQYHHDREEFWKILSGTGTAIVGEETFDVEKGREFFIAKGVSHRITAGESPIEFLEISFGAFSEDDIVRLEDNYGRAK